MMTDPSELDAYLEGKYGSRDALIIRDPEAPAGFREWTPEDSEGICRWVDGNGGHERICRNLRETAQAIGVSIQTVQGWMRRQENPLPHIRDGRRVIVPDFLLFRWMEQESGRNAGKNTGKGNSSDLVR